MRLYYIQILLGAGLFLTGGVGSGFSATDVRPAASNAYPILQVGWGARAMGLGESFASVADDASAVYWNVAGLGLFKEGRLLASHFQFAVDGSEESLAAVFPMRRFGAFGVDLAYRQYGSFDARNGSGVLTGTFKPYDLAVGLSFGFHLHPKVCAGIRSLWFRQSVETRQESGLLEDLGLLVGPLSGFKFGTAFKNVGLDSSGRDLPLEWKISASKKIGLDPKGNHRLLAALGTDVRPNGVGRFNGGLEYAYREKYFLRGGWTLDRENNELGGLKGLCAGAGAVFSRWTLDYALTSSGYLGWEHRVSLGMRLPASEPPPYIQTPIPVASPTPTPAAAMPPVPPEFLGVVSPTVVPTAVGMAPSSPPPSGTVVVLKFNQEGSPEEMALSAEQLYARAEAERMAGREDESLRLYLKCVEKDPRNDKAWVRISQVQYKKALEAVQKALNANPSNPALQMWLNRQKGK